MLKRTREATSSINPNAITTGSLEGNLNSDQMYTGRVGSVPVRKNAITNSSSDMVNPIKRLEIKPGDLHQVECATFLGALQAQWIRPNGSLDERIGLVLRLTIHRQALWRATSGRCSAPVGQRLEHHEIH